MEQMKYASTLKLSPLLKKKNVLVAIHFGDEGGYLRNKIHPVKLDIFYHVSKLWIIKIEALNNNF